MPLLNTYVVPDNSSCNVIVVKMNDKVSAEESESKRNRIYYHVEVNDKIVQGQ